MSERSVIAAVLVALAMVGLWQLTETLTARTTTEPSALLNFDPAAVDGIEVAATGRDPVIIERVDILGSARWMVRWNEGDDALIWPADEAAVRAALRVLSTATIDERKNIGPVNGGTVTLRLADGTTRTLTFAESTLAGRVEVVATSEGERKGLTDATLYDAFIKTDILAWRDRRPLPSLAAGPARVELISPSGTLTLIRRQGRWTMLKPADAPVNPETITELTRSLASLTVERFMDSGADTSSDAVTDRFGFDTPLATIITETALRTADNADAETIVQSMLVGKPTDATGETVFVRLEWTVITGDAPPITLAGPVAAAMSTQILNDLTTRPEPYIGLRSVASLPAAIEALTLTSKGRAVTITRNGPAWAAGRDTLLPDESTQIDELITLLADTDAAGASMVEPEAVPIDKALTIRLATSDGSPPLTLYAFAVDRDLLVFSGPLARQYPEGQPMAEALTDLINRVAGPMPTEEPKPE
jgi:uncharacterized protein DUF4340